MSTSAISSGLSVAGIQVRNQRALDIESAFKALKPGQRLTAASAKIYLERLDLLKSLAVKDLTALNANGIKATPQVLVAKKALDRHITVLARVQQLVDQKVSQVAKKSKVIPVSTSISVQAAGTPIASASGLPWEGQLRKGETPLHWAVRNHDHKTALILRFQLRQSRILEGCVAYASSLKPDSSAAKLLKKKPDLLPKVAQAIDIIHVLNKRDLSDKQLLELFKAEPDVVKVIQDPNFRKILDNPRMILILNCEDLLGNVDPKDLDANGISPIQEAILQNDREMTHILLFPHLIANPLFRTHFWGRNEEIQGRIATMRQVDPTTLSPVCRAAYEGAVDELENANDLDKPDKKGLTPLHYALLGGQIDSIQYLLSRTQNLHVLTPQKHSYLDYAILSGNASAFGVFSNLKLPFKLGKDHERFNYLVASGIFNQQMVGYAQARDPLAAGGTDQNMLGVNINAVWAGSALLNLATGYPDPTTSWLGWAVSGTQNTSLQFNRYITGTPQVLNTLPNWARTAHSVYALSNVAYFLLNPVVSYAVTLAGYPMPQLNNWQHLSTVSDVASKAYTALRMWGAVKPVIDRIPTYRNSYKSRPKQVMKALGADLFNIASQGVMSYAFLKAN